MERTIVCGRVLLVLEWLLYATMLSMKPIVTVDEQLLVRRQRSQEPSTMPNREEACEALK